MNHGWNKKKLGELTDFKYGYPFDSKKFNMDCNGMPLIRIRDVIPGRTSTYYDGEFSDEYIIKSGDYLIGMDGEFNIARWNSYEALLNQRVCKVMSADNNVMLNQFLYFFLKIELKRIEEYTPFVTVKHLSAKTLNNIIIPIPPLNIQNKLVSELDKINELIGVKRSQLKDLDALAQSLFYETFGDPLENSKRWNVGTLSEYANFKNGLNFTPADDGNKIKCLGVGDFKSNRYIKTENLPEINIVEAVSEEYRLKDGDIILVRSNGNKALIGRSIMYVSDNSLATFSGFCIRCRYNREKLAPLFLSYYLSCGAIREYITSQGRGCNISNLNQKILSGIPLILPPLSLQNEFAEKIEAIEEQKRLIESSIANLETLLASRMDYWFND